MTITELILCAVCFGVVSFLVYLYVTRKNYGPRRTGLAIALGFIAQEIEYIVINRKKVKKQGSP